MSEHPGEYRKPSPALAFIFVTIVLDVLALGIIIPVLPKLVEQFLGGNTARAAEMFGLFGTAWALMQFIFSPFLGALSDRYGRRRVILISCFGLGLDYIFMAMAPTLSWLFVGRIISGITAASFTAAAAYIADVTPSEKRAAGFGMMGAAWGLGFVLGPAVGGLLGGLNPRLPFWVAAGLTLLNALYGVFVLPESLPKEAREKFSWRRANPFGSLTLLRSHPDLLRLSSVNVCYFLAHQVLPSVFVLYASYRFGWDQRTMGLALAGMGACGMIVQGGVVKRVVGEFGERKTLLAGLIFGICGFAVYGFAATGIVFSIGIPLFSLIGLYGPSAQSIMTRHVQPMEQGQLQGANNSINGLTGIIGPGIFSFVFAHFIDPKNPVHLPGAPFLIASVLLVVGIYLAWNAESEDRPAIHL